MSILYIQQKMKAPDKKEIEDTLLNRAEPEEAQKVVRWFATDEGEKYLSEMMDKDAGHPREDTASESIDHEIPSDEMYGNIMKRIRRQSKNRRIWTAAAVFIPFLVLAGLYIELSNRLDLFSETEYEEICVPKKEQMQFIFQDGSRVYLNSGSRLRFPRKFGLRERKVELEGEGFFEIAKNKKRPFIVDMQSISVKVLGTSFDAKAYPNEEYISVSLENGEVVLEGNRLKALHVKPGEKVIYNRKTGTYEIVRPKDIQSYSAWKQKKLVFKDTPLAEVVKTLGRTFDVHIEIADDAVLNYSFTLSTDNHDIHFIMDELEKIAPIYFETNEGVIYIKPKK